MAETVVLKYIGHYKGVNPQTGLTFSPGEVREVTLEQAEILVESGQFILVEDDIDSLGGEQ